MDEPSHRDRLRELSTQSKQRPLTAAELLEVAGHFRAIGNHEQADRAERAAQRALVVTSAPTVPATMPTEPSATDAPGEAVSPHTSRRSVRVVAAIGLLLLLGGLGWKLRASTRTERAAAPAARSGSGSAGPAAEVAAKADRAFASGKQYYVWVDDQEPLVCPGKSYDIFRAFPINYRYRARGGKGPEFSVGLTVTVKDQQTGKKQALTTVSEGPKRRDGTGTAVFVVKPGTQLEGSGTVRLLLLKGPVSSTKPEAISNEVTVQAKF